MGGWVAFCLDTRNADVLQREFIATYESFARIPDAVETPQRFLGINEADGARHATIRIPGGWHCGELTTTVVRRLEAKGEPR